MNLWDIQGDCWDKKLLALTAEDSKSGVAGLSAKLGNVEHNMGSILGSISEWFVERFGFSSGEPFSYRYLKPETDMAAL